MAVREPGRRQEDSGQESGYGRRMTMLYAAIAAVALFIFLVGYFLAFGPFHHEEAAYAPAGRNLDVENKAAPPPQPTP